MEESKWLDGIMGVVVGDALGCPVQFKTRSVIRENPVTDMIGHGTFDLPEGSWTDDSSLTLALLSSLREKNEFDLGDIAERFVDWLLDGKYTPYGFSYDIGQSCLVSIRRYNKTGNPYTCGTNGEYDNGNGSLMRIIPICLFQYEKLESGESDIAESIAIVHQVSALTHAHLRAEIACGIYFFIIKHILDDKNVNNLQKSMQHGINEGLEFYLQNDDCKKEIEHYTRLFDLEEFKNLPESAIQGSGYVVDALEAAIWCLLKTTSYKECTLKAVNLGDDTDTVAAIAGGLAGLYYGYDDIPEEWLAVIKKRDWIEGLCERYVPWTKLRAKYIGDDNIDTLTKGKYYDIVSIKKGAYLIIDDSEEQYMYPSELFEIEKMV